MKRQKNGVKDIIDTSILFIFIIMMTPTLTQAIKKYKFLYITWQRTKARKLYLATREYKKWLITEQLLKKYIYQVCAV